MDARESLGREVSSMGLKNVLKLVTTEGVKEGEGLGVTRTILNQGMQWKRRNPCKNL